MTSPEWYTHGGSGKAHVFRVVGRLIRSGCGRFELGLQKDWPITTKSDPKCKMCLRTITKKEKKP